MPILTCTNLTKRFLNNEAPIINGASLSLEAGEFVSIMGRSGSGKSTLLRLLCGLLAPDAGEVVVDGLLLSGLRGKALAEFRSLRIGIVFQDSNLITDFTVKDNIFTPCYIAGKKPDLNYFERLLCLTNIGEFLDRMPTELSGGERQRVAICRALIAKPKILYADEPTGSLDSKSEQQIMQLFTDINAEFGTSIIQVTHSDFCAAKSHKIITINDGKIEG
jgi:putative ABC transport system ATP-binding protein